MVELKLNTHMNLLNPDCVKRVAVWERGGGGDDKMKEEPALPAWPPSAPCWLHHDSRRCWAGRAGRLQTHRNRQTDRPDDRRCLHIHTASPACLAASYTLGPGPRDLLLPRPDLSRKGATGRGGAAGPGRWVVVTRSR